MIKNIKSALLVLPLICLSFTIKENNKISYNFNFYEKNELPYIYGKTLTLNDFNYQKNNYNNVLGRSFTGISYSIIKYNGSINVDVCAVFDKQKSFIVVNNKTEKTLNHEQRHFDITYLFSLKFIDRLKSLKNINEQIIDEVYAQVNKDCDEWQKKYDLDTEHSVNNLKQKDWDNLIYNEIKYLRGKLNIN